MPQLEPNPDYNSGEGHADPVNMSWQSAIATARETIQTPRKAEDALLALASALLREKSMDRAAAVLVAWDVLRNAARPSPAMKEGRLTPTNKPNHRLLDASIA